MSSSSAWNQSDQALPQLVFRPRKRNSFSLPDPHEIFALYNSSQPSNRVRTRPGVPPSANLPLPSTDNFQDYSDEVVRRRRASLISYEEGESLIKEGLEHVTQISNVGATSRNDVSIDHHAQTYPTTHPQLPSLDDFKNFLQQVLDRQNTGLITYDQASVQIEEGLEQFLRQCSEAKYLKSDKRHALQDSSIIVDGCKNVIMTEPDQKASQ